MLTVSEDMKRFGLDDLCVRFIINLPQEELESVERICFQVEEAQWYYEDFIRPLDPDLPSLSLRNFCLRIFQHCPLLSEFSPYHHATAFEEFLAYKTRVPVRGAIMLNDDMNEVILVKGWKKGANWSFPRGKINKDESDLACAIREVYEETGFDVDAAGLVGSQDTVKYIDVAIQHQHIRLYVFRGIPMDTPFEARTRKEISKIEWWKLSDLPTLKKKKQQQEGRGEDLAVNANKFYMVAPFLVPLKKWISQQKKMEKSRSADQLQYPVENDVDEPPTEENELNGNGTVSASEDMERLLAGLRQPTSVPVASNASLPRTDEASSQLKSLLRVPTKDQKAAQTQTVHAVPTIFPSTSTEEKRASALLALLRGGPSVGKAQAPQTPIEQLNGPLSVPESPKPQQTVLARVPNNITSPAFPFSPEDIKGGHNKQSSESNAETTIPRPINANKASVDAWNKFETTSAEEEAARQQALAQRHAANLAEEQRTGVLHESTLPALNETWRQVKIDRSTNMRHASNRHVSNTVKRSVGGLHQTQQHQPVQQRAARDVPPQAAPAPYQATSNVQVSANLKYPDIYRPVIPAANKLPMPKITAHSSSLLNLFKGGQSGEGTKGSSGPNVGNTVSQPISNVATAKSSSQQTPRKLSEGPMPGSDSGSPKPLPPARQKAAESKKPSSAHQATLLELFRKPSILATGSTSPPKPTPDAPAHLVELSAMPSPGHSREPSKAEVQEPEKVKSQISNKRVSMQNRVQANNAVSGKPPVFATVNGPLNEPQFEMIANRSKESRRHPIAKEVKRSPVTILARPAGTKAKSPRDEPRTLQPGSQHANGPAVSRPAGRDADTQNPPTPKQILRRPIQSEKPQAQQEPFLHPPVRPPSQQRATPSPLSTSDDQPPLKPNHKANLLSLFTTASLPATFSHTPPRPDMSAFVSPVAAKPPSYFSAPPKATNKSHAGVPALNGMAYTQNRNGNAESRSDALDGQSRPAPKKTTSDVDRNFLLGYLESVARKEGK
ncbi:MAG: hypothetical protein Q9216_003613 [Gyalolechia sp. 2 TL-2023]